jgi:hypothetical protein
MSIRVDPRRLSLLKELAAAEGLRPGQLVQRWVEERLDAERSGEPLARATQVARPDPRMGQFESSLSALSARLDSMVARLQILEGSASAVERSTQVDESPVAVAPRRRGRPPKARPQVTEGEAAGSTRRRSRARTVQPAGERMPLHDEIIAVIRERGPMSAAELAQAIKDRGRYQAPRSARPLDAATVNSRVSNPVYRSRFRREAGRINLAE